MAVHNQAVMFFRKHAKMAKLAALNPGFIAYVH
jgi:hypothetical protein